MKNPSKRVSIGLAGTSLMLATLVAPVLVGSPAVAADDMFCAGQPMKPVSAMVDDEAVKGLTTVKGSTPVEFTGSYVGKISNALGKDAKGKPRDLLLMELEGPQITNADGTVKSGIWSGMSGSPVYSSDGKLIGAVAYGFSISANNVAGVTPAEYMKDIGQGPSAVKVSSRARSKIAGATAFSAAEIPTRMHRLGTVNVVSGVDAETLLTFEKKLAKTFGKGITRPGRYVSGGGGTSNKANIALVPGGPIAVSYAQGAVSLASVGTVTAVCGNKVFAFGHPGNHDSTLNATIHGAHTASVSAGIQSEVIVGEIGKALGRLTYDGMAGITGTIGALPKQATVTSVSTVGGVRSTETTLVAEPQALPEAVAMHAANEATRMLDNGTTGSVKARWQIEYQRKNGKKGVIKKVNHLASRAGLGEELTELIGGDVAALVHNDFTEVSVPKVTMRLDFTPGLQTARVSGLQIRKGGTWKNLKRNGTVKLKRGKTHVFRAKLTRGAHSNTKTQWVTFKRKIAKGPQRGLRLTVGATSAPETFSLEDFFEEFELPSNFNALLATITSNADRNDVFSSDISYQYRKPRGKVVASKRHAAPVTIVQGKFSTKIKLSKKPRR